MAGDPSTQRIALLPELAAEHAAARGEQRLFTFLADGETPSASLSFGALDERARSLATELVEGGQRGRPVLLLLPPGLDFVVALFACFHAGAVAVPVAPARPERRLEGLLQDSGATAALSRGALASRVRGVAGDLEIYDAERYETGAARRWRPPVLHAETPALLQYTSGSTGTPRGVTVSHGNLVANQRAIRRAFGSTPDDVVGSWLPMHHDMGLIGAVLHPFFLGARGVLMAPVAFLRRPARWLRMISEHGVTLSGGPDFAYDLCVRRISESEKQGLDLCRWRVAFDGAEPVHAATLEAFGAAFAGQGFAPRAFVPCYGLAEATLLVSGGPPGALPCSRRFDRAGLEAGRVLPADEHPETATRTLVGCGLPAPEHRVMVVDPATGLPCATGRIGEIWLSGPSVAGGYWRHPRETADTLRPPPETCAAAGSSAGDRWLRTGDLGFLEPGLVEPGQIEPGLLEPGLLDGGELFVAGRLKDLIIVRGRNLHPQDLERRVSTADPRLVPGGAAAFTVDGVAGEGLVVVQEVAREHRRAEAAELSALAAELERVLAEEIGVVPATLVLVPSGGVPRTTSGKIRRRACRAAWLGGELEILIRRDFAGGGVERWLAEEVAAVTGSPAGGVRRDLPPAALGLDSLAAAELEGRIEARFGVRLGAAEVLAAGSLDELSARLTAGREQVALSPRGDAPSTTMREAPLDDRHRALFFLHQLDPRSTAYHLVAVFETDGSLDPAALASAARDLALRHEALRAVFDAPGGQPRQRLAPALEPDQRWWPSPRELDGGLRAAIERLAEDPFDLAQGPPWRLRAWPVEGGSGFGVALVVHHLVADLPSMTVLVADLLAFLAGGGPKTPAPSWWRWTEERRQWLEGEAALRQGEHWRRRLTPLPPVLDLPLDRPADGGRRREGVARARRRRRWLAPPLRARLEALAAAAGATPFVLLATALATLLARWSGQSAFALGTVANRNRPPGLVGYGANPLVLCFELAPAMAFSTALEAARREVLGALANQDYPFPRLVEDLRPELPAGGSPLFRALFGFHRVAGPEAPEAGELLLGLEGQDLEGQDLEGYGRRLRPLAAPATAPQFDLSLTVAPARGGWLCRLDADPAIFDATTAERLLRQLELCLDDVARRPGAPLAELAWGSAGERHQLSVESRDTVRVWPPEQVLGGGVQHRVAAAVRRWPEAVALSGEDGELTYAELGRRVGRLAATLRDLGAGPERVTAVLLERGLDLPVALLAVLVAGAVYLPLEPSHPPARLAACVADAAPLVVVGCGSPPSWLGDHPYLDLGSLGLRGAASGEEADLSALVEPVDPSQAAYLFYTSGSTGRPKGVVNTHGALLNRLLWMQRAFPLAPGERVLHKTPSTFDVSMWELLWPLTTGSCMVVAPPGAHRDPALLARWVEQREVAVVHFVPSLLEAWVEEAAVPRCHALRWVVASGEELRAEVAERCLRRLPAGARLANLYGPTEAAVDVTAWVCSARERDERGRPVPIGRPIDNLEVQLVGPWGRELVAGAPGEIQLGGVGLARGYWGDPRRTAESFVPDPAPRRPGARLYRTGDLGYRRADGALVFLRRRDLQVQLHGVRVEPGEIEAVLRRHPAVAEAVVVPRAAHGLRSGAAGATGTSATGTPETTTAAPATGARRFLSTVSPAASPTVSLAAYVIASGSAEPDVEELRAHALAHLPATVVPATFTVLEGWPRTSSGKIDRAALPAPRRRGSGARAAPPSTPAERAVVEVWEEVLELEGVGVEDDFFVLGGDSILSLRVRAALENRGWGMALEDLYRHRGARRLAASLEPAGLSAATLPDPFELLGEGDRERLPEDVEAAYPLGATQAGVLFHAQFEPRSALYRHALLWRVSGPVSRRACETAVRACAERHEILRTSFDLARFSLPLQLVHRRVAPAVVELDLSALAATDQRSALDRWLAEVQARTLDWARPPLVGFALLRLADDEAILALTFLDALLDGWSAASLATEVLGRYDRLLAGLTEPSLPLPRPFRGFVGRERSAADDPRAAEFWAGRLAGSKAQRLPCWSAAGAPGTEVLDRPLAPQLVTRLEALAASAGAALKHVLLALHAVVLGRLAGRDDVVVAVESNGRSSDPGAEATLGMHVNLLPLRIALRDASPEELVAEVRRVEGEALPWRLFPFSSIQRQWGKEGLADTVFNYTQFHVAAGLSQLRRLRVLEVSGVDRTSFALRVDFNREPRAGRLRLTLSADRQRLDRGRLQALAEIYSAALDRFASATAEPLGRWSPWSAAQRHRVLVESSGPPAEPFVAVHRRVAAVAHRVPEAVAVVAGDEQRTYGELRREWLALAARLRALGVGRESVVAVAVARSVRLPAVLLGILETGAAYLPLDPSYPPIRLRSMIADAGARVAVAEEGLLSAEVTAGLVVVDPRQWGAESQGGEPGRGAGDPAWDPCSIAYVLYTSGSAGAPKGVLVRHGSLANLVSALIDLLGLGPRSHTQAITNLAITNSAITTLAITTLAFDISALEIFAPLVIGGRLEIAPDHEIGDGVALAGHLRRTDPSWLQATPSTWRLLLAAGWRGKPGLVALCGGEALSPGLASELRGAGFELWNLYGPTETTVWSTAERVTAAGAPISIGRALAGTRLFVTDSRGRPVCVGTPGELWIGGEGVARGYAARPALTAGHFTPDPFSGVPGGRVYRTGDLVRWAEDGRLCFLGRVDSQLKLRGHRIEPDEIVAALELHPGVGRAVVVARSAEHEVAELVAFVLPAASGSPSSSELRQHLHDRLPRFMVPRRVVLVDRLPLTANGKVDLRRLPMPPIRRPTPRQLEDALRQVETLSEEEAKTFLGGRDDGGG